MARQGSRTCSTCCATASTRCCGPSAATRCGSWCRRTSWYPTASSVVSVPTAPEPRKLDGLAWPALAGPAAGDCLLVLPLGSTEQHGPHLPFSTDTDIAVALAERLASTSPGVVVAPPLPYGSSGEHAGFAGTLSIGAAALEHVVVELVRSAD